MEQENVVKKEKNGLKVLVVEIDSTNKKIGFIF